MVSYVKEPLMIIKEDVIVVEAGHMGLAIHVPISLFPELPGMGKEVTVCTYFQVGEGAMALYGLLHGQDRDMFGRLLGVNGIGPEGVLGVLSVLRPGSPRLAIASEDVKALVRAPDIGNKAAQHLILDLKDKISMDNVLENMAGGASMGDADTGASMASLAEAAKETVQALTVLGYANTKAPRAVKRMEITGGMTSEDVLKASLKHLSFL